MRQCRVCLRCEEFIPLGWGSGSWLFFPFSEATSDEREEERIYLALKLDESSIVPLDLRWRILLGRWKSWRRRKSHLEE